MRAPREEVGVPEDAIVAALEQAWQAIRRQHAEVPPVSITLGTGKNRRGKQLRWGRFTCQVWANHVLKRPHEVLITTERVHQGAEAVVTSLLHEAAHAVAEARCSPIQHFLGVRDTRPGVLRPARYHTPLYRDIAHEVGLDVTYDATYGWAQTALTAETRAQYADELEALWLALPVEGGGQ